MTDRITVSGFRRPRSQAPSRKEPRVWPIRPRNLIWVAVLGALPIVSAGWGTPHMLLNYSYTGRDAFLYYTDCAYLGLDGAIRHTRGASCPVVRFLKRIGG